MTEPRTTHTQYDRIAHLYDVDMAQNMAFDDVSCYVALAGHTKGRVLEMGCGNGRILLPLLARGIDVVGIDFSAGMLARLRSKSAIAGTTINVCQMDARSLAFGCAFDTVLCPYSLVTYMTDPADVQHMLDECMRVLTPGGMLVVDAFIPREALPSSGFRLDYRRPYCEATLQRSKRVTAIAPGINRIERRYEVVAANGAISEQVHTVEDIRTFSPEQLAAILLEAGLAIEQTLWDYKAQLRPVVAQFCTLVARK